MNSNSNLLSRDSFIENGKKASNLEWIFSRGTNYTCYLEYLSSLDNETILNNKIDVIRTIIYALHRPLQFTFFYWTMLIFILHKFNFRKPVMKIILAHFILRSMGNVVDKFGGLMVRYYANEEIYDNNNRIIGYKCRYDSSNPERHPLRWFLTRQIGCTLWCVGEIIADWYPLIRTKALAWDKKSILLVYFTCGMFNLSKVILFVYHYTLFPSELYNDKGVYNQLRVDSFYLPYWIIQLLIIYSSVIYDFSVYYVLKKNLSEMSSAKIGFIKKFKTLSQYRILVSTFICFAFLPIISITIIFKIYYFKSYGYHKLNFSFDEIRLSINNVQYYMIFIDQILLLRNGNEDFGRVVTMPSSNDSFSNNNDSKSIPTYPGSIPRSQYDSLNRSQYNVSINDCVELMNYKSIGNDVNMMDLNRDLINLNEEVEHRNSNNKT